MSYIIETEEQLRNLIPAQECFIKVIPGNDSYHPLLSYPSLIYYRTTGNGYLIPIKHSESLGIELKQVQEFITKHNKVYCVDQKQTTYYLQHINLIDINQTIIDQESKLVTFETNTNVHVDYYTKFNRLQNVNELIPLVKHYEKWECLYDQVKEYLGLEIDNEFYTEYCKQYQYIEKQGILIENSRFSTFFESNWQPYSIQENIIYTSYNLYNLTTRPTNSFNSVNFLALNKDDGSRESFIPKNHLFLEFDFDAYHLKLIANLIGYEFNKVDSIHSILGREYFKTGTLTEVEYTESKAITFQQIYGGIRKEYRHIEFFNKIDEFIHTAWQAYIKDSEYILQTGRPLHLPKISLTPQKLFNYIIQNLETRQNVLILKKLNAALENKKSKIVLVVYDSFLIDYSLDDGKQVLLDIKNIIEQEGFTIKVKVGKNYSILKKTNYL